VTLSRVCGENSVSLQTAAADHDVSTNVHCFNLTALPPTDVFLPSLLTAQSSLQAAMNWSGFCVPITWLLYQTFILSGMHFWMNLSDNHVTVDPTCALRFEFTTPAVSICFGLIMVL